jgi:hypothetical protein
MRHSRNLSLVLTFAPLAAAAALALTGCKPKMEPAATPAPSAMAPMAAEAPAATPPAPPAETAGQIGVAACDEYLDKWENCLATKVTGDARDQVRVALDASRDAWKRAAATPDGKAGLTAACEQAADLAKMQVSAYGCTW